MTRILYAAFDRAPAPKGASRHILAFLRGLTTASLQVDACLLTAHDRLEGARCLSCTLPEGHLLQRALAFGEWVRRYAQAGSYALIHFRSLWEGLALTQWPGHPPLVYEVNGLPSLEWPVLYPALQEQPGLLTKLRQQERAVVKNVEAVITPSPITAALLREWGARQVEVIPNGVNLAEWQAPQPVATAPEIFYMGTFSPWQGLNTLVEAFAHLSPPWRLRLIGERTRGEAGQLLRQAQGLAVADRLLIQPALGLGVLARRLAQARVAVAPLVADPRNLQQGACPIKILEYLAAGCPVVASRLPTVEALLEHGASGWLVAPDNPIALAKGLCTVLNDAELTARLRQGGLVVARMFTWERAVERVLAVYRELGVTP
ncbi:MAG: glycosyltransferase family 4 protein [Candidatus Competibacteraceae bacterium]